MPSNSSKHTNHLIHESSPYLLQHAHNPVNWYPWGKEALEKAKNENKMLIISIGYAACHWCHVMEQECFEDEEVAKFMNDNFIAIKVDREERPDIDQVYMNAVQLITGQGGWPLNCLALPDGSPIHGGTYYPKKKWLDMLSKVSDFVKNNPVKAKEHALALTQGVKASEKVIASTEEKDFIMETLDRIFDTWKSRIDFQEGGSSRAPKFPLPIGYQFLLQYHYLTQNEKAEEAVFKTLDKMAFGGIYDQIGGGFSRYSTDKYWKVPHFEKMLYDNAQLISLYSMAYQKSKNTRYKTIVTETISFVERELSSPEGGFYSSLDADSEGEEGRFYVWKKEEIQKYLGENAELICDYYAISDRGNWEMGSNILHKKQEDKFFAEKYKISESELLRRIQKAKKSLLEERSKRIRPGLDDKILTSWNALMIKAYVDAYRTFNSKEYMAKALENAEFILKNIKTPDYRLYRNFKNGKASINAFLDDYAFTITAFISLYQASFDEKWLREAHSLTEYVITHFYDKSSGMFFYTSDIDPKLIARKTEITDNVIPSSNSEMAKALYLLGHYLSKEDYIEKAGNMLSIVQKDALNGGAYYANWDILMAWFVGNPYEIAIIGENYEKIRKEFEKEYLPNIFLSGGKEEGSLALHKSKYIKGKTTIYVCRNKVCQLPVYVVKEALKQLD